MSLLTQPATCRRCEFAYVTTGSLGLCGRCWSEDKQPCAVCEKLAEASTVGTPSCSEECLQVLIDTRFPEITERREPVEPKVFRWPSFSPGRGGSVEKALGNIGTFAAGLQRHKQQIQGAKMAFCPFHPHRGRTPSLSLYERRGVSRGHCHVCGWDGSPIDLEAQLSGKSVRDVIREWS